MVVGEPIQLTKKLELFYGNANYALLLISFSFPTNYLISEIPYLVSFVFGQKRIRASGGCIHANYIRIIYTA